MKRNASARRRHARGQTLVELAFVLPIFLVLVFGLIDLGRGVYAFNTLSNAARTGARLAIVNQDVSAIQDLTVHQAVGLGVAPSDVSVDFEDLDAGTDCPSPYSVGCAAVITVHYQFAPAVPVIGALIGSISMSATSQMRIERVYP